MIGHFERDFRKKKMIFLGVFRKENPNELIGTAEIFEYNPKVNKVVIGYRFNESCWVEAPQPRLYTQW
jgi:ribosomal-protein-alanine N-acetyltransferase